MSWKLTLILFVAIPPFIISMWIFIRMFKKFTKKYQDQLAEANSFANEAIGNIRIIKSFATEKKEINQFFSSLNLLYKTGKKKVILYGCFLFFSVLLANGAILGVLWCGGTMVMNKELTAGELTSFSLYTITMSVGLLSTGGTINMLVTAVGVAENLFKIMDEQPKIVSGIMIPVQQMRGGIQFQNVSFAYPSKQAVQVIQKMDVDIKPGENVAIVGTSGSGKSTIVSLIERFYDITNGEILIDGVNIKELDWDWLHQNIGFVSQEPTLFSGTLINNIVYGVEKYQNEELEKAIEMANAKSFIYNKDLFPEGLQTVVGERGIKLSGG